MIINEPLQQTPRNKIANLLETGELAPSWLGLFGFHTSRVAATSILANSLLHFLWDSCETEKIFGSARSPYIPDGNIGEKPEFLEAVKPGENHWAMTKGLNDATDGSIPLVFENPSESSWPPKWNAIEPGWLKKWITEFLGGSPNRQSLPGQAWLKGKIIIGRNDGSVELYPLESENGKNIGLKPYPDGTPIFPLLHPGLEILNVAK